MHSGGHSADNGDVVHSTVVEVDCEDGDPISRQDSGGTSQTASVSMRGVSNAS